MLKSRAFFSIKRWKRRLPYLLFFGGLLLGFAALLGEHLEEFPSLLRIVAPRYCEEINGIEALKEGKILNSGDEGFVPIANFLITQARIPKGSFENTNLSIIISNIKMGPLGFGTGGSAQLVEFNVKIEDSSPMDIFPNIPIQEFPLERIQENANALKEKDIFYVCLILFGVASIFETIAFFMEEHELEEEIKEYNSESQTNQAASGDKATKEN